MGGEGKASAGRLPGVALASWRLSLRYWTAKLALGALARTYLRVRTEGLERLPAGPALLCANHMSWADPIVLMAALPGRPRLHWFGPRESDMHRGARNRLIVWTGTAVPYKPAKTDLLEATRRVDAVFRAGGRLVIFGEGRIHAVEGELLPLADGAVFFALRARVPIVPVAISGTSWLGFGRTVRVRIGEPLLTAGRPTREAVDEATARLWCRLFARVRDDPIRPAPGPLGRWLTAVFDEWAEGERPERTPGAVRAPGTGPVDGPYGPCDGVASPG
ncbi:MAG TPA: lysophospholipid acyltransferase family protein [Candidatus Dormibacteraeota bacterium]|nr:lysophospholipid acyltransferase family protein [Candidatus Dormibacteraeota bacterium]